MLATLTIFFFFFFTAIQVFFWLVIFRKLAIHKSPSTTSMYSQHPLHPVSVIICAKNEAENLKKNLPYILNQNYPFFEVIVVNDNSTDETEKIILDFKKKYKTLCLVSKSENKDGKVGKKFALSLGIEVAKHNVLLLTDADCQPTSPDWIRLMQEKVVGGTEIVLGYSPYRFDEGFLNAFIRYETVQTAIQYLSFALWKNPYMGVGRNMMYRKSLYYKVGGFKSHEHVASGDDDLFINATAHLNNTTIIIDSRTFVLSEPKKSWKKFFQQKSRHMTTSTSYRLNHKMLLGLLSGSHFMHFALGTFTLFQGFLFFAIIGYLIRMSIMLLVSRRILQQLEEKKLFMWIPMLDVCMVFYYIILAPAVAWGSKNRW